MAVLLNGKKMAAQRTVHSHARGRVLVAESDASSRNWLVIALNDWGYDPVIVQNHDHLVREMEVCDHATVILDSDFDSAGPLAALGHLWLDGFAPNVILVTDDDSAALGERALKMGALTAVTRSSDLQPLRNALSSVVRYSPVRLNGGSPLLGNSPAIRELRDVVRSVADSKAAVMIVGESGTGKELVARAIHDCSPRAAGEYVPVNMAALPENLVESVLFGYERGAFTGAEQRQEGMCQHAHGGTLFLDEIGEMNRELQPKLLRFLQDHTVQRVGSTLVQKVDARIVSATNRNVQELVQSGALRHDLFYRLHVIPIQVPALRDRAEDIPVLVNAFLNRKCQQLRRTVTLSDDVMERLCRYSWPGNIRQLENLIERLVVVSKCDVIGTGSLPAEWFAAELHKTRPRNINDSFIADLDLPVLLSDRQLTRMESAERQLIIESLYRHDWNVSAVARFLGLGSATLYRKLRSLEITRAVARNTDH